MNRFFQTANTPLHLACRSNKLEIVQVLISNGADVNKFNVRLETPIHVAAENGYGEICKALTAAGATVHQKEQVFDLIIQSKFIIRSFPFFL